MESGMLARSPDGVKRIPAGPEKGILIVIIAAKITIKTPFSGPAGILLTPSGDLARCPCPPH